MTPILTLWLSDSLDPVARLVDQHVNAANPSLHKSLHCHNMAAEELARHIVNTHEELVKLDAADTTLHIITYLPVFMSQSADAARTVTDALEHLSIPVTFDIIGLQLGLHKVWDTNAKESDEVRHTQSEVIRHISSLAGTSRRRVTLSLIDNYTEKGASAGFSIETLPRCLATITLSLLESYPDIFSPTLCTAATGQVLGIGLSQLTFPRNEAIDYLVHKAFVVALEREGILVDKVDITQTEDHTRRILDGIELFHDHFYNINVDARLNVKDSQQTIASGLASKMDSEKAALEQRLTGFFNDSSLSLPEKEAILAMMLGNDNRFLKGSRYSTQSKVFDDALVTPVGIFVDCFNRYKDESPSISNHLPVRGNYSALRIPEIEIAPGEYLENEENGRAFNPHEEIKRIKSEILDITAYIRKTEKQIEQLRERQANERMADTILTEEGMKLTHIPHRLGNSIAEQPLQETYIPDPQFKPAASVDLRKFFSAPRNQGAIGSCSSFAVIAMYEAMANKMGISDIPLTLSESFVFYHTNVATGRLEEGSNFHEQFDAMGKHGSCLQKYHPYNPANIMAPPTQEAVADAANHLVVEAKQIKLQSGSDRYKSLQQNHHSITSALTEGYPVGLSLKIYDDFGSQPGGHVPRPSEQQIATEESSNHAMVIVGYSDANKCYIVRNSWGESFGDKGYCYISAAYIDDPQFNNFCCILTAISEGTITAGGKTPELVAQIGGTETMIRIASLSNAIDEARIRFQSLNSYFAACYTYYSDLLARISMPNIRNDLREVAEAQTSQRIAKLKEQRAELIDKLPSTLKERSRNYIKNALILSGVTLLTLTAFGTAVYIGAASITNLWWIYICTILVMITIAVWGYYSYQRKLWRTELNRTIEDIVRQETELHKRLDVAKLKFYVAGLSFDALNEIKANLTDMYERLKGYNNNLQCWHSEDSEKSAILHIDTQAMFESLLHSPTLLEFFDRYKDEIAGNINLIEEFSKFNLSTESIKNMRQSLEEITRRAISAKMGHFSMARHIVGTERYTYLPPFDIQTAFLRLNRMAAVLTRHADTNPQENRFVLTSINPAERNKWLNTVAPHFSNMPIVSATASSESITIFTLRSIDLSLLI